MSITFQWPVVLRGPWPSSPAAHVEGMQVTAGKAVSDCLPFLGTGDDYSVRPPVWPLSVSFPTESISFRLNCCYYEVNVGFRHRIPLFKSGGERLLLY